MHLKMIKLVYYKKTRTILTEKPTEKNLSGFSNGIPTKTCRKYISVNSSELRRKILTEYIRRYFVIRSRQKTDKKLTNIWPLQKIDTYRRNTDGIPTMKEFGHNSVGFSDGIPTDWTAVILPDWKPTNLQPLHFPTKYRRIM